MSELIKVALIWMLAQNAASCNLMAGSEDESNCWIWNVGQGQQRCHCTSAIEHERELRLISS
jgi:hypothetical protein